MNRPLLIVLASLSLLILGCQTSLQPPRPVPGETPAVAHWREVLTRVDRVVAAAGTRDTAVFPITGFPFLRTSRFLAETARQPAAGPATRRWLERMHALDLAAREKEIVNLDADRCRQLARDLKVFGGRRALIAFVHAASRGLFAAALARPSLASEVRAAATVPGEYRLWRRALGLYPLVALPVAYVSAAAFDEFRQWHAMPPEQLPRTGRPVAYRLAGPGGESRLDPTALFRKAPRDALGLPLLAPGEAHRLAAALAPIIVQDTAAAYDRIGAIRWLDGRPAVATTDPVVYYYLSQSRFDDRASLQINYVFWYSRRAGENAPWIERGRLDGLTVRISLDTTGRPVMLDIMNNCGCYHFFVPDYARIRRIKAPLLGLDPLVPAWLPPAFPLQRLQLTVTSGWHQVLHIAAGNAAPPVVGYTLRPYETLEMLPDENGQHRSIFDRNGIAFGSERIEPLLFFSMGIPAVGSMRQRGHHAIQLVGRAHFDDPLLFDATFDYR